MRRFFVKYLGVLGFLVVYISILLALLNAPWFSLFDNALSDLGVHEGSGIFFNSGLIIGGSLVSLYSLIIYFSGLSTKNKYFPVGLVLLFITGLLLSLIGVFTEQVSLVHFLVAFSFFMFFPLASIFLSFGIRDHIVDRSLLLLSLINLIAFIVVLIFPWKLVGVKGLAIPELILAFLYTLWFIYFSYRLPS